MQVYWGNVFILFHAAVDEIEKICRVFFWGYENEFRKMVYVSWKQICEFKECGGIGIKEVFSWNKVCFFKVLWKIDFYYNFFWVYWIYNYCLKGVFMGDIVYQYFFMGMEKFFEVKGWVC